MQTALESNRGDNLRFRIMDIDSLSYVDEFDLVFSNATMHWIKAHHTLLVNVYRALKQNGMVRFNFAGGGNCINFNPVHLIVLPVSAGNCCKVRAYFKPVGHLVFRS